MATETSFDTPAHVRQDNEPTSALFAYELARSGRLVARLVGFEADADRIRVTAEIYPVDVPETNEPQRRFYDFPNRQKAQGFADEAVLALEYLGCVIREGASFATQGFAGPAADAAAA